MRPMLLRLAVLFLWLVGVRNGVADVLQVGVGRDYPEIDEAVQAAADGDLILVQSGTYAGSHVVDKSLSIVGVGGAVIVRTDDVRVSDLAPHRALLIAGIMIEPDFSMEPDSIALKIEACQGAVRLQDVKVRSGTPSSSHALAAVQVDASGDVVFTACNLRGGAGGHTCPRGDGFYGGAGLRVSGASRVAVHECVLRGGVGGDALCCFPCVGGDGGQGAQVFGDSFLFASGSSFFGGAPGTSSCCYGLPGLDLDVYDISAVTLLDCQLATSSGSITLLPGSSRALAAEVLTPDATDVSLTIHGLPGDAVLLLQAVQPDFVYLEGNVRGVLALARSVARVRSAGVLTGDRLDILLPIGELPMGIENARIYVQAVLRSTDGSVTCTGPVSLAVID